MIAFGANGLDPGTEPRGPLSGAHQTMPMPLRQDRECPTPDSHSAREERRRGVEIRSFATHEQLYSMTSSARARIDGGKVNPIALTAFRLTMNLQWLA